MLFTSALADTVPLPEVTNCASSVAVPTSSRNKANKRFLRILIMAWVSVESLHNWRLAVVETVHTFCLYKVNSSLCLAIPAMRRMLSGVSISGGMHFDFAFKPLSSALGAYFFRINDFPERQWTM